MAYMTWFVTDLHSERRYDVNLKPGTTLPSFDDLRSVLHQPARASRLSALGIPHLFTLIEAYCVRTETLRPLDSQLSGP